MSDLIKQDMHDLTIYNDFITSLITLKVILENIDKISIVKDLEINNKIKELEAEKIDELELLQEELRFRTLKNRYLGRLNKIEEGIKLREQTKKKIDDIEELKEEVKEWEFNSFKILQDLNYGKYDKIVEIAKIEFKLERLGLSKESIDSFKKLIIPKNYLHFVL